MGQVEVLFDVPKWVAAGRLREQVKQGPDVPQLVATNHLRELAQSISEQLIFQNTLLPCLRTGHVA